MAIPIAGFSTSGRPNTVVVSHPNWELRRSWPGRRPRQRRRRRLKRVPVIVCALVATTIVVTFRRALHGANEEDELWQPPSLRSSNVTGTVSGTSHDVSLSFTEYIPTHGHVLPSLGIEDARPRTSDHTASATTTAAKVIVNGWERLGPSTERSVYGEDDSPLVGRSCKWVSTGFGRNGIIGNSIRNMVARYVGTALSYIFFLSTKSFVGEWVCRDCDDGRRYSSWEDCPRLSRRGKCAPFRFQGWDEPKPRSFSHYDPNSAVPHPIRILTSYGVGRVRTVEYEQPQCGAAGGGSATLTTPCFDMNRCYSGSSTGSSVTTSLDMDHVDGGGSDTTGHPPHPLQSPERFSIYAYPGRARHDLEAALQDGPSGSDGSSRGVPPFVMVDDPHTACLLLVHADDVRSVQETTPATWDWGRNHYVYSVSKPITDGVHYGMAALGSVAMTNAQIRWGYDIPLPLPALWSYGGSGSSGSIAAPFLDGDRPRRWLVSFKGSIQDTLQPYYQHRWLAAEYLHGQADVEIDVQCKHKTVWGGLVTYAPYDHPTQHHYDSVMIDSTFAFCPGGSHVTSFRFSEVLSAGAIPVLPPEVVTPFSPEVDWTRCVVRVSQARIVDLPRLLRNMTDEEVNARRSECRRLYETLFVAPTTTTLASDGEGGSHQDHGTTTTTIPLEQQHQQQQLQQQLTATNQTIGFLRTALKVWELRIRKQRYADELHRGAFG